MQPVSGVLLDVDGTLVDSNDAHAQAWGRALLEHGIPVPFAKVRRLIGKGGDKLLPEVADMKPSSPTGKAISKRRGEIFQNEFLPHLHPFPGAKDLLVRMKREQMRRVVASSAKDDELERLLRVIGANELVEARTSSDDVKNSKPSPDVVESALERIGLPAESVILLGDTPYDVEAANRGRGRVALRCGGWQIPIWRVRSPSTTTRPNSSLDSDESPFLAGR